MVVTEETVQPKPETPQVPSYLIYEVLNGQPVYYRGYRDVLAGKIDRNAIMGSSSLQSFLVSFIYGFILNNRDKERYVPFTNEAGLHIGNNDNLAADIAIYEKGTFQLTTQYFNTPPKVVIEVDIKADVSERPGAEMEYIAEKTQRLFDFGVEKVFWVLSKPRRVFVAVPNQDWIFTDWSNDVPILEGCVLNVKKLLEEEGILY
ncbi:Uma2 family endonuclease [Larkinella terrae]|uniref:Uma2 family endonuclease n=1 Tax=Larkinella terrae TaxID=2025311 RepID=A0A7K0EGN4_9BACT|nr:Uma2 family endonuclease [Larkinella terrae]MRS61009.1 Uma2 family endonuclease [Larkinella terrae]